MSDERRRPKRNLPRRGPPSAPSADGGRRPGQRRQSGRATVGGGPQSTQIAIFNERGVSPTEVPSSALSADRSSDVGRAPASKEEPCSSRFAICAIGGRRRRQSGKASVGGGPQSTQIAILNERGASPLRFRHLRCLRTALLMVGRAPASKEEPSSSRSAFCAISGRMSPPRPAPTVGQGERWRWSAEYADGDFQ
jgi:hypothetical protein